MISLINLSEGIERSILTALVYLSDFFHFSVYLLFNASLCHYFRAETLSGSGLSLK